jgi:hypothetical protein
MLRHKGNSFVFQIVPQETPSVGARGGQIGKLKLKADSFFFGGEGGITNGHPLWMPEADRLVGKRRRGWDLNIVPLRVGDRLCSVPVYIQTILF